MSFGGGNTGGGTIASSNDVVLSSPTTGQDLSYDEPSAKWKNRSLNKTDVGLDKVDNTADAAKPVSMATQSALDEKIDPTELAGAWGVLPTLHWVGGSWPARTVPAGYSGAVIWDSAGDQAAAAPLASVTGDRWRRRVG